MGKALFQMFNLFKEILAVVDKTIAEVRILIVSGTTHMLVAFECLTLLNARASMNQWFKQA